VILVDQPEVTEQAPTAAHRHGDPAEQAAVGPGRHPDRAVGLGDAGLQHVLQHVGGNLHGQYRRDPGLVYMVVDLVVRRVHEQVHAGVIDRDSPLKPRGKPFTHRPQLILHVGPITRFRQLSDP
jgi:hypothetical protein